jgi:hypothetical protein
MVWCVFAAGPLPVPLAQEMTLAAQVRTRWRGGSQPEEGRVFRGPVSTSPSSPPPPPCMVIRSSGSRPPIAAILSGRGGGARGEGHRRRGGGVRRFDCAWACGGGEGLPPCLRLKADVSPFNRTRLRFGALSKYPDCMD